MKKITFTILVLSLFSIGFVKAQALDTIPNGDFERWIPTPDPSRYIPQGWDTLGGASYPVTEVDYSNSSGVIQRPVYDGKYALDLTCKTHGQLIYFGRVRCKFAMKHKDPFVVANVSYFEGTGVNIPAFGVVVWNSKTHDTLVNKNNILPDVRNDNYADDNLEPWVTFSIPITYNYTSANDTTTPDSGAIYIQNAINIPNYTVQPAATILYVEKIWFANAASAGISTDPYTENNVAVYPNPFTNKTTIHYTLIQSGEVNLAVYDMNGKEVSAIVNGNQGAGTYNQVFDATGLNNGVYIYKLQTSSGVQTGKLILSK